MDLLWAEAVWVFLVFLAGITAGSFINVVVGRLPLEKSVLWPNSRCLTCLNPLELRDNLPIVGYLLRRGKCRFCGSGFSSRYMWVELATGIVFAGLYYVEVLHNWHRLPFFDNERVQLFQGVTSWQGWVFWLQHVVLFSFLLAASLCDWDHRQIPLSLTVTGMFVGLIFATAFPWPFPNDPAITAELPSQERFELGKDAKDMKAQAGPSWAFNVNTEKYPHGIPRGLYPWPVWGPLSHWLENHRWALGLLTGLAGAAAGMILIRVVKFLFEKGLGKEALGLGDADLMMMAGAFVGWQVVIVSFFLGALLSLPLGLLMAIRKGDNALPFGPGLAGGVMVTLLGWKWIAPYVQGVFFDEMLVLFGAVLLGGGMFLLSGVLRLFGRGPAAQPAS